MLWEQDRNGRVVRYGFDHLNRNIKEEWFSNGTSSTALNTLNFTLDLGSNLDRTQDAYHDYLFQQDNLNRVTVATQTISGLASAVELTYGYSLTGQRTKLAGKIGSQNDFLDQMQYDGMYRLTQVTRTGQSGGNAVSNTRVNFNYDKDAQLAWIFRYGSLTTTPAIATTRYLYDVAGRNDKIDHFRGYSNAANTKITGYDLNWDAADRLTAFLFTHTLFSAESVNAYGYDKRSQLVGADFASTSLVDEAYTYDHNGNRLTDHRGQTYSYGNGYNQLTNDSKYQYLYDNEGNRTRKNKLDASGNLITGTYEEFVWDHRNRLTQVKQYEAGNLVETVTYAYDSFNQLVRRTVALTPVGGPNTTKERFFVLDRTPTAGYAGSHATQSEQVLSDAVASPHDLGQTVLQFDSTATGIQVSHRYLWGPGVDLQLADEQLPNTNGDGDTRVIWPLVDHLGTVRDLVEYVTFAAGGSRTILQKHRTYDSFGNVLSEYNRGDFDGDGDFDATDIDMLFQFVAAGSFGQYNGVDVNGDGVINAADIDAFIWDVIGTVYGDANMDGVCDVSDLNVWNANKFQTGDFGWAQADFNGDNVVDTADWNIWNANKFTGTAGQLNTAVLDHIFGFTGRMFDEVTNLQNNLNRWYDPAVGRWVSEDPYAFQNLYYGTYT